MGADQAEVRAGAEQSANVVLVMGSKCPELHLHQGGQIDDGNLARSSLRRVEGALESRFLGRQEIDRHVANPDRDATTVREDQPRAFEGFESNQEVYVGGVACRTVSPDGDSAHEGVSNAELTEPSRSLLRGHSNRRLHGRKTALEGRLGTRFGVARVAQMEHRDSAS